MEHFKSDFDSSLGPCLGRTIKIADQYVQEVFDAHEMDITKEQMIVLKQLSRQDGMTQGELAALILRDKSSLARLLSKMENKDYVKRRKGRADKRNKRVFLTPRGRQVLLAAMPVLAKIMATMEKGIGAEQKAHLISTLEKIQDNFAQAHKNAQPME
ncbi:MarR family winged helix-turn-helix transcriptional regulator [Maribacter sp. 2307ULW6-5]|uniref:MarR family winged helix-turn-helix transcriptional regulator n=1 Tax=Maribacter sp. 2307ULW6-5 TaxID=3386275 RepID=UPI0039BCB19B